MRKGGREGRRVKKGGEIEGVRDGGREEEGRSKGAGREEGGRRKVGGKTEEGGRRGGRRED